MHYLVYLFILHEHHTNKTLIKRTTSNIIELIQLQLFIFHEKQTLKILSDYTRDNITICSIIDN